MKLLRTQVMQAALGGLALGVLAPPATAGFVFTFDDGSGLSAEAEFTLTGPTTLVVRLKNTSTGIPGGFSNSDQLLTGISWDFVHPGLSGDAVILGGSATTGPTSFSVNFDVQNVGPNEDVSGEWGYGNSGGSGLLPNFITAMQAHSTPFGGANLDGPVRMDGPQGGLVSSFASIDLGGIGAIQDEIIASLDLSRAMTESELLDDLASSGLRVEFGSDAYFIDTIPASGMLALFALAGLVGSRRRRSQAPRTDRLEVAA